jgi:hypothetical protein
MHGWSGGGAHRYTEKFVWFAAWLEPHNAKVVQVRTRRPLHSQCARAHARSVRLTVAANAVALAHAEAAARRCRLGLGCCGSYRSVSVAAARALGGAPARTAREHRAKHDRDRTRRQPVAEGRPPPARPVRPSAARPPSTLYPVMAEPTPTLQPPPWRTFVLYLHHCRAPRRAFASRVRARATAHACARLSPRRPILPRGGTPRFGMALAISALARWSVGVIGGDARSGHGQATAPHEAQLADARVRRGAGRVARPVPCGAGTRSAHSHALRALTRAPRTRTRGALCTRARADSTVRLWRPAHRAHCSVAWACAGSGARGPRLGAACACLQVCTRKRRGSSEACGGAAVA